MILPVHYAMMPLFQLIDDYLVDSCYDFQLQESQNDYWTYESYTPLI